MSNEEYKNLIHELIEKIQSNELLELLYRFAKRLLG